MRSKWALFSLLAASAFALALMPACRRQEAAASKSPAPPGSFTFAPKPRSGITFLSTQMNPVEEAGKMRNSILKDFPGKVDFRPNDNSYIFSQIDSLLKANPLESILIGALHGDLVTLYEQKGLRPLDDIYSSLEGRGFIQDLVKLGRLDGKTVYYIPWMQASFVMVANRKALAYLPKGAVLEDLTYEELLQWVRNIQESTGMKALGFPAGGKGLMHRFFQGYLYPSFTGSTLLRFRSADARAMWEYFRGLWQYAHPGSLVYSTMAEPLLLGDVWIAWDHTARLVKAFEERPKDFVAFPAPIGPKGRGFMPVISGFGIPAKSSDSQSQAVLMDYLTRPEIQSRTLAETGFFPVADSGKSAAVPDYLVSLSEAVKHQATAPGSVLTLLPIGLGKRGGDYNNLFMLAFSRIVLENGNIQTALNSIALELQRLIDSENARCWLPDSSTNRPCKLE